MKIPPILWIPGRVLLLLVLCSPQNEMTTQAQQTVSAKDQTEVAEGFKTFLKNVDGYVKLHKSVEATLPSIKPTDLPELIYAHQLALARKIREARPNAKQGDIFTEDGEKAFRFTIKHELSGPQGPKARATIRQGEPLTTIHLKVNEPYPDGVPLTTVPPSLLLKFPKLPDQVAYRIVGGDLLLLDVAANLVVDRIPEVTP